MALNGRRGGMLAYKQFLALPDHFPSCRRETMFAGFALMTAKTKHMVLC
jgi:hypothetical protein